VSTSDADAITASLSDPRVFAVIFDRHASALHRYLRRRVGSDVADELASETFERAFEHRQRFNGSGPDARPWLFGIAQNLLRHHYRSEQQRLRLYADTGFDSISGRLESDRAPETDVVHGSDIAMALAELSPGERDVLLLVAWADLTYEDVAQALRIPVGTVRSRLNRARSRIRRVLEGTERTSEEAIWWTNWKQ
jgi:RNA polymerase sigma-70 factor (ECF subfamily)